MWWVIPRSITCWARDMTPGSVTCWSRDEARDSTWQMSHQLHVNSGRRAACCFSFPLFLLHSSQFDEFEPLHTIVNNSGIGLQHRGSLYSAQHSMSLDPDNINRLYKHMCFYYKQTYICIINSYVLITSICIINLVMKIIYYIILIDT